MFLFVFVCAKLQNPKHLTWTFARLFIKKMHPYIFLKGIGSNFIGQGYRGAIFCTLFSLQFRRGAPLYSCRKVPESHLSASYKNSSADALNSAAQNHLLCGSGKKFQAAECKVRCFYDSRSPQATIFQDIKRPIFRGAFCKKTSKASVGKHTFLGVFRYKMHPFYPITLFFCIFQVKQGTKQ